MAKNSALWLDVARDLRSARRSLEWALQQAAEPPPADVAARFAREYTIGGMVHNCYGALESALQSIVLDIDGALPAGSDHHRNLIRRAAQDFPDRRPPILSPEAAEQLDELRGFRHVFRHAYDDYDYSKAESNVAIARSVLDRLIADLTAFAAELGVDFDPELG